MSKQIKAVEAEIALKIAENRSNCDFICHALRDLGLDEELVRVSGLWAIGFADPDCTLCLYFAFIVRFRMWDRSERILSLCPWERDTANF